MPSAYSREEATTDHVPAGPLNINAAKSWGAATEAMPRGHTAGPKQKLLILGTRGVPAQHGGFETFAQQLVLYLAERGWDSGVYCQIQASERGPEITETRWNGVGQILIPSRDRGSLASIMYDLRCILDAVKRPGTILLLGYNTAIFAVLLRLAGRNVIINMDGLEWQRPKWSRGARLWLWLNERIAAWLGTTLVADHPEIRRHLTKIARNSKLVMIPYGAPPIEDAAEDPVITLGLKPRNYYLCISRIEPENSQLQIVAAFSATRRNAILFVLGTLDERNAYHRAVRAAASDEVIFAGAIYDQTVLASLRFHAAAYCHGHTVGGTNPSLVEALGAGCAVIAHDNRFNRWTAGPGQFFFQDGEACAEVFDFVCANPPALGQARESASRHHRDRFLLDAVLAQYERLIGFDLEYYCQTPLSLAPCDPV
jgi:glycosyltransferase involved in cell wall biosynthesis